MSSLISFWSAIPQGTRVTVRKPGGERFNTCTIGQPFPGLGNQGFILVATIAAPVSLDRVSLGWEEPRPEQFIPLATAIESMPATPRASESPALTVANFVITAGTGMLCGLIGGVVLGYAMLVIATWGSR